MIYCLYYLFIIKKKNKFRRENKRKKKTCNQISSIHSSKAKSSRWIQGQEHKNGGFSTSRLLGLLNITPSIPQAKEDSYWGRKGWRTGMGKEVKSPSSRGSSWERLGGNWWNPQPVRQYLESLCSEPELHLSTLMDPIHHHNSELC